MYRYCVKCITTNENFVTYYKFFPFMPTYKHPWTDEELYKYFDLSPEEIGVIENEIQ